MQLQQLQINFADAIDQNSFEKISNYFVSRGLSLEDRFKIYKNNIYISLSQSLKSVYPIILILVGEDFFNYLVFEYIKKYNSTSGNISYFGEKFPIFLEQSSIVNSIPYLSEIAQFEWSIYEIFNGEDYSPIELFKFNSIDDKQYQFLKLKLNPNCQIFSFKFPILTIFNYCKSINSLNKNLDLGENGEKIFISRLEFDVIFQKLTDAEYIFLNTLKNAHDLMQASRLAFEIQKDFDLEAFLRHLLVIGIIVDFSL